MEILDQLQGAFDYTGAIVATLTPSDLDRPTPCPDWDVRALLNHTIGVVAGFESAADGKPFTGDTDADFVGTDPATSFQEAAKATLHAWSQPGAFDGMCTLPRAGIELPRHVAAAINVVDTLVHG